MGRYNHFQKTKETLAGYPCVKHQITEELQIHAVNALVYQYDDKHYVLGLKASRKANRIIIALGSSRTLRKGEECKVPINTDQLHHIVIPLLKIPKYLGRQVTLANAW